MTNKPKSFDPIKLEIFKHLFASIAEEMGVVLRKSSYSANIKERRDFSCALFDAKGNMIAQAAHIPVHLGAMPLSVKQAIQEIDFSSGDVVILNDPYRGGTHLPDITIISPIFINNEVYGFAANRAHHADVGGSTPGSMSISKEIYQEGLIIPPLKISSGGEINQAVWELILSNVRTPIEREGDLKAQLASNNRGKTRLKDLVKRYGFNEVAQYSQELLRYSERMTRQLIKDIPDGIYDFCDYLDDDGFNDEAIKINVEITIKEDRAIVDFSGSADQQQGSVNAVYAITLSAVYYVFRCLLDIDVPNNSGSLEAIEVIAPEGTVVNAKHPAPVAGGNVETSQRIVDVLLGALAKALPDKIPSASQGTMNNTLIGGWDSLRDKSYTYYETIGGGMGARPNKPGVSAIHSHMTNTLNTPTEALEFTFPFQVLRYEIRRGTGGKGKFSGGDGIRRDIQLRESAQASILSDRRKSKPYGLNGGKSGCSGKNILIRDDKEHELPSKCSIDLKSGDILSIRTPGGGGYGKEEKDQKEQ